jgi:hypothetical protein
VARGPGSSGLAAADLDFRPLAADEGDGAVLIAAVIDELRGPYFAR